MPSIDLGVVQQFLHPPLEFLHPVLDSGGPYSGNLTLYNWGGSISVTATFGVVLVPATIPTELGYTEGWSTGGSVSSGDYYPLRLAQLVVQRQLAGGSWVSSEIHNVYHPGETVIWAEAAPGRLGLYVLPGVTMDLYYLVLP